MTEHPDSFGARVDIPARRQPPPSVSPVALTYLFAAAFVSLAFVAGCNGKSSTGLKPRGLPNSRPARPVVAKAWQIPKGVTARKWRYIVVHHSGTNEGSAAAFDRYHRNVKGWKDLAYHFVIGNGRGATDGVVEVGPRWKAQRVGAHAGDEKYNRHGIGICLVGNFEKSAPTKKQRETLAKLVGALKKRFGVPSFGVKRHSDIGLTKCPGKLLPWPVVTSSR
jgi:N-acetyl-anhydromuramyl-L-alanine amidase AmpD